MKSTTRKLKIKIETRIKPNATMVTILSLLKLTKLSNDTECANLVTNRWTMNIKMLKKVTDTSVNSAAIVILTRSDVFFKRSKR